MANKTPEQRILEKQSLVDQNKLRQLALKINHIPREFAKIDGSLDLDKVHLKLMDYHKK